jgi:hypothetical protein
VAEARLQRDFLGMLDVFVSSDRSTIGAGRKWLDEVDKALKRADLEIVLCSRESMDGRVGELRGGSRLVARIPVIPVCHSGLRPDELPVPLSMLEGITLSRPEGLAKLCDAVASTLPIGSPPSPDFATVAREAGDLEARYVRQIKQVPTVENPRVLCAASEQYAQPKYGFELDIEVVERYFPGRVAVEHALTSQRLLIGSHLSASISCTSCPRSIPPMARSFSIRSMR